MIDIERETLLTPRQALAHPALRNSNGRPAHISTFHRLCDRGSKAPDGTQVRLDFVRCPGGRRTSAEAIARFVQQLTAGGGSAPPLTPSGLRRRRQLVDQALDREGIA